MTINLPTPEQVEAMALDAGLTITEACRRANVARSTFTRWKAGEVDPSIGIVRRIIEAIQNAAADLDQPSAA